MLSLARIVLRRMYLVAEKQVGLGSCRLRPFVCSGLALRLNVRTLILESPLLTEFPAAAAPTFQAGLCIHKHQKTNLLKNRL